MDVSSATEAQGNYQSSQFILKIDEVPSARTEADSEPELIAATSRPTIGNTHVTGILAYSTFRM